MLKRQCRMCGAEPGRWWPYCTACDSLYGIPIVAWVLVLFLAAGVYAMFFDETVATVQKALENAR